MFTTATSDSLDALRETMARNNVVPAAGKVWHARDESTRQCLTFPEQSAEELERTKWREPGVRVRHPGSRKDPVDTTRTYGIDSAGSEHVPDVIKQEPKTVLEAMLREHGERQMPSYTKEPLGKARIHSGDLPAHVTGKDYRFGIASSKTQSAKELLYPPPSQEESKAPAVSARYQGIQGPGEQRSRDYKWENTTVKDPRSHRFGMTDPTALRDGEGAARALNPEADGSVPSRTIVPKRVADFQQVSRDHLGRAKNLGRGEKVRTEPFGVPTVGDNYGAGDCIRGEYSLEDQMPDPDLGKSISKGYRNFTTDPTRVFGVPTIRTDIPVRTKASVADHQNYGNDADAKSLLHPSRFVSIGVDHSDFAEQKSPAEIRALFEKIGYRLDDGEFEQVWNRAAHGYDLNRDGIVSVEEFRLALNEYDDAREEGRVPAWFKA